MYNKLKHYSGVTLILGCFIGICYGLALHSLSQTIQLLKPLTTLEASPKQPATQLIKLHQVGTQLHDLGWAQRLWFTQAEHHQLWRATERMRTHTLKYALRQSMMSQLALDIAIQMVQADQKPYSKAYLQIILQSALPKAVAMLERDQAIFVKKHPPLPHPLYKKLVSQTQSLYLDQYRQYWQAKIQSIGSYFNTKQRPAKTLFSKISHLLDPMSSLRYKLHDIYENTTDEANLPVFKQAVSQHFTDLDDFLKDLETGPLHQYLWDIAQLLRPLAVTAHADAAAFELTQKRFMTKKFSQDPLYLLKQHSATLAAPYQSWISNLHDTIWHSLLFATQAHIKRTWTHTVFPFYKHKIHHKYPIEDASKVSVRLKDFSDFFGPGGLLERFFTRYIQPFTIENDTYLTWKTVDGATLSISPQALTPFIQANWIQAIYFPKGHITLKFSLMPTAFLPEIQQLTVDIDGQLATYHAKDPHHPVIFTWPGKTHGVYIQFTDTNHAVSTLKKKGDWACLRLLKSHLNHTETDAGRYQITLDLNGKAVKCKLRVMEGAKLLIYDILSHFRCPKTL